MPKRTRKNEPHGDSRYSENDGSEFSGRESSKEKIRRRREAERQRRRNRDDDDDYDEED